MEAARVEQILASLRSRSARDLESQTLEFKSWCRDEKEFAFAIAEACVCLTNADGGLVIGGVEDRGSLPASVRACPYPQVSSEWLKAKIRELTKPPVRCNVNRLGEVLADLRNSPAGDIFVVEVIRTNLPSGHRTNRGVSYVRAGNECRTEYFVDGDDFSDETLSGLTPEGLDPAAIGEAITSRSRAYPFAQLGGRRQLDHLQDTDLIRICGDADRADGCIPTVAALILFGTESAIRTYLRSAQTVVVVDTSTTAPLTTSEWRNLAHGLSAYIRVIRDQLSKSEIEIPENVLRELLLNAFLHRCYRTPAPIQIRIRKDELEIQNPGGLLGGLTTETILWSPPIYRNFLLADAARQFGYCEKAGNGIDKVYHESILSGFDFPIFQSRDNSFSAIIRTSPDKAFAKFIRDFAGGLQLSIPELIALRVLRTKIRASAAVLASYVQRDERYMEQVLKDLERKNILRRGGSDYVLSETILNQIARYNEEGQLKLF